MRLLASYSLEASGVDIAPGSSSDDVHWLVEDWLKSKGDNKRDGTQLVLSDGRVATLERTARRSTVGTLTELVLTEPTGSGWFRTSVSLTDSGATTVVSITLSAGSDTLSPVSLDVHCPRLVRRILDLPSTWRYGASRLVSAPLDYHGIQGGDDFITVAWSAERSIPIVAVSDEGGAVLHPGIVESLAADLAGLALVARLDPGASWRLTARKGKEWSCYGGAIRLYWPRLDQRSHPFDHPLWTPHRLLTGVADTETAAGRIRSQLRRRILSQSAFAIPEHPLFAHVRKAVASEDLAALQAKASEDSDYRALAEGYFNEMVKLQTALEQREDEAVDLRAQVSSLQLALRWKDEGPDAVEPDLDLPPSTVEEAVLLAMEQCGGTLVFGAAVNDGILTLAKDAGPPDKILTYLRALSKLTEAKRGGPIGTSAIKWLEARGVVASLESETVRNSPREQELRTWDDGSGKDRTFEFHLKPNEATAPDRCVRIYFEYDEAQQKTIVGWVGRHP